MAKPTLSENVEIPDTFTLSSSVWPSTSNSTKSPLPTNVVAVTTPAIETLSRLVCPSTSKSPLASIAPVNVEIPVTFKLPIPALPLTSILSVSIKPVTPNPAVVLYVKLGLDSSSPPDEVKTIRSPT